ncbi:MAG: helix-turn-helix domain-containing protein [Firmicutes bacterium]|nr:helix-turn-helix domain-containing protein [Bacillota bacterium]
MVNAIGAFLRNLRFKTGETLKEMAEKLDYAPTYLSGIENGKRDAPRSLYDKVVSIYELSYIKSEELKNILYSVWMTRDYDLSPEQAEKVKDIFQQSQRVELKGDSVKKIVLKRMSNKELSVEQCEKILTILEETDNNIARGGISMVKSDERTKPIEHIKLEYSLTKDVVVWFKADCTITKKTLISVPDGFKMQVVVADGSRRVGRGRPIAGPCIKESLAEKLSLSKAELSENVSYSFYYYVTNAQLLTFPWGAGAQSYDHEFEIAYKWGAYGTYTISIEDPIRLVEAVNRINPIKKADIDPVNPKDNILFSHVEEKAKDVIASFLADNKISVLNINARLKEISDAVTKEMSQDNNITSLMGVKFLFATVGNIGLSESDAERVNRAIEEKKAKQSNRLD